MSKNELKCLTVGTGNVSKRMGQILAEKSWYKAAGIVDINEEALQAAREYYAVEDDQVYTDLDRALDESDANVVIVNTPAELHYRQSKAALEAGKHVLVAKPFATEFSQAEELVALAAQKGVTISVGQQVRYIRHYNAVRRFIESGKLGNLEAVWFMNSKPRPKVKNLASMKQPALIEMSCHHFDSLLSVFGERLPEWISCDGFIPSWSKYNGPCMVNALIKFSDGLHVSYHGGFSSQTTMYDFRLEGSEGALQCRGLHMSNDTMDYEFAPALGKFAPIVIDDDLSTEHPFYRFFDIWYDYVNGGEEPPFSGRNNLVPFAMLSAAAESVDSCEPVDIRNNPKYQAAFA